LPGQSHKKSNYYIESQTRGLRRTDVIVDYRGEQYIIEQEYHTGGQDSCGSGGMNLSNNALCATVPVTKFDIM